MSARDELAKMIHGHDRTRSPYPLADEIVTAGFQRPKVLGYIVVDRGGVMVGNQHKHEESAQAFAAEWTKDCQDAGIDWDYRVATITEAAA